MHHWTDAGTVPGILRGMQESTYFMPTPAKTGLLDWARRERAAWELLLAEVGEARMSTPGAMGDWTFRDLLCCLASPGTISPGRVR